MLVRRVVIWCLSVDRCIGMYEVRDHLLSVELRGHSVFIMRRQRWYLFGQGDGLEGGRGCILVAEASGHEN